MEEIVNGQSELDVKKVLDEWRQKYGAIFFSEIEGIEFVWRELSRSEYLRVLAYSDDDAERQEFICELCVLEPLVEDYSDDIYAGFPQTLSNQILIQSGFTDDTTVIDELMGKYDEEMVSFSNQVGVIIKEIFPEYTLEEIDRWGLEKTIKHYSKAKWALENLRGRVLEPVE